MKATAHNPSVLRGSVREVPYNPAALRRRAAGSCGCQEPAVARIMAERVVQQAIRKVRASSPHEGALARAGADPIVLAAGGESKCRPFLTVQKDQGRFEACNALADSIGPLDAPKKAAKLIREAIGDEVNEVFGIVTLDIHQRMKSIAETGRGESAAVMAPMVPTLQAALIDGADGVILFHVHPSGVEAEPSDADKDTTEAFADAFEIVNVNFFDHIIIGHKSFYSFLEDGAL